MLRRAVAAPLQPDEQTTWAREFARLHGADLLGRLLEPLDLPAGSGWLDVRTQLRRLQRGAA
jgi:hypothetical protein